MKRFAYVVLLFLVACGGSTPGGNGGNASDLPLPDTSSPAYTAPHPTGFSPTLLSRYQTHRVQGEGSDASLRATYSKIRYAPRSSAFRGFEGWDVLELPRAGDAPKNWLQLTLTRDARLAVAWEDEAGWLNGWDRGEVQNGKSLWTRDFSAGVHSFPAPGEGKSAYTLLLAEKGGVAPVAPVLPAGISELERPEPNETCPEWVHNLYTAEMPDGSLGKGWHPQIDPVYWCYFGHEHGADPSLVGYEAAFHYIAKQNNNQNEQHEGFKGYAIQEDNVGWYFNTHITTSNIARVCARHHTVVVVAYDLTTGDKLAELGLKGDFGFVKTTAKTSAGNHVNLQPQFTDCPDQAAINAETEASKAVRVKHENGFNESGYERWRGGLMGSPRTQLGLSFRGTGLDIDIRNPMTACDTFQCNGASSTNGNGTRRTIRFNQLELNYDDVAIIDSDGDGVFYTNQYGDALVAPDHPNAVRQYIKPGTSLSLNGHYTTEDAWRGLFKQGGGVDNMELENSLGENN